VLLNPAMSAALDRIAERAADVRRAFAPGAVPHYDDVATSSDRSDFTLDPLSVAPPAGAYFVTLDARGRTIYTRDGSFSVRSGRLVDERGLPVLGRRAPNTPLDEMRIDPVDEALGRTNRIRIDGDGSLIYARETIDPRTGKRAQSRIVVGRVALARFPAGSRLDTADGRSFTAPPGVAPHTGFPGDGSFDALAPMRRAHSRVDLDASLIRLKDAYTAFDALAAAEHAKGRLEKTAMDVVK
jgi:flagellar basal body rod protein FlgG